MYKVTPSPPATSGIESIDPQAANRALAYYILPRGGGPTRPDIAGTQDNASAPQSREKALVNASSILDSAAATAYENADNLTGANRKVAMGVVHLIELAQRQVDSVIEDQPAGITN